MKIFATGALVAAMLAAGLVPAHAASERVTFERALLEFVNEDRADAKVRAVRFRSDLAANSRTWSAKMAKEDFLATNPNVRRELPKMRIVRQIVGDVPAEADVAYDYFWRNANVRAVILDPRWNSVAFGVVFRGSGRDRQIFVSAAFAKA